MVDFPINDPVVVVLSGGLDSVVLAFALKDKGYTLRLVYMDYAKPVSDREKAAAKLMALRLNSPLEIINMSGHTELQLGYAYFMAGPADDEELDVK